VRTRSSYHLRTLIAKLIRGLLFFLPRSGLHWPPFFPLPPAHDNATPPFFSLLPKQNELETIGFSRFVMQLLSLFFLFLQTATPLFPCKFRRDPLFRNKTDRIVPFYPSHREEAILPPPCWNVGAGVFFLLSRVIRLPFLSLYSTNHCQFSNVDCQPSSSLN